MIDIAQTALEIVLLIAVILQHLEIAEMKRRIRAMRIERDILVKIWKGNHYD